MTTAIVSRAEAQVATLDAATQWRIAAGDWLTNLPSARTSKAYADAWKDFLTFAGDKLPDQVSQSDVIAYRFLLKTTPSRKTGKPFSQSTINQRLSALSSFFSFAQKRNLRPDNPVDGVSRESVTPYGKATWLDPEENEDVAFLKAIDDSTDQGKRDRAIALLYLTGAFRVSELANLTVDALRRQGRSLFVTYVHKGGEEEEVVVAEEAADALDAYLATRGKLPAGAPLFVATERGRKAAQAIGRYEEGEVKPLTTRAIRYLVKTYADKALGPGNGIRPHSLRHTAAQALLVEGGTLTEVSRLLKHKSMQVTTIYLHATKKSDKKTAGLLGRRYGSALAAD
jgi:integrase/recombinase XerD